MVGLVSCRIQFSSNTSIICQIGINSNLQAGTDYLVQVRVKNIGIAIPRSVFMLKFLPIISLSSPAQGLYLYTWKILSKIKFLF